MKETRTMKVARPGIREEIPGGHTTRLDGEALVELEVNVDVDAIARSFAYRATWSKGRKRTAVGGYVQVKLKRIVKERA